MTFPLFLCSSPFFLLLFCGLKFGFGPPPCVWPCICLPSVFFLLPVLCFLGGMCLLRNITWFNGIWFFYTFVCVKCNPSTICHKTSFESGDSSRNKLSSTSIPQPFSLVKTYAFCGFHYSSINGGHLYTSFSLTINLIPGFATPGGG